MPLSDSLQHIYRHMPGEEICSIINAHPEDCGQPPQFEFDDFNYVSYFENSHGEQSISLYDSEVDEVVIYLAVAGWENPQILSGQWLVENTLPSEEVDEGILPDADEKLWLKACKSAVKPRIEYALQKEEEDR